MPVLALVENGLSSSWLCAISSRSMPTENLVHRAYSNIAPKRRTYARDPKPGRDRLAHGRREA